MQTCGVQLASNNMQGPVPKKKSPDIDKFSFSLLLASLPWLPSRLLHQKEHNPKQLCTKSNSCPQQSILTSMHAREKQKQEQSNFSMWRTVYFQHLCLRAEAPHAADCCQGPWQHVLVCARLQRIASEPLHLLGPGLLGCRGRA